MVCVYILAPKDKPNTLVWLEPLQSNVGSDAFGEKKRDGGLFCKHQCGLQKQCSLIRTPGKKKAMFPSPGKKKKHTIA